MIDIREYLDRGGHSPFREWRSRLNAEARRKVTTPLYRVGLANFSNVKGVGAGVFEPESTSVPDTEFILEKMANKLSSFLVAARNSASRTISIMH